MSIMPCFQTTLFKGDFMKNKIQFSKMLTILSFMMFVWTLYSGFSASFNQLYDISVYVTAITVSGGIFGVCLKSYMSKSKAENIYKVQKTMYEDIMDIKLYYNEEMMKLIQKYSYSIIQPEENQNCILQLLQKQLPTAVNQKVSG